MTDPVEEATSDHRAVQRSDVVVPAQHEIEIYENEAGAAVIKMDAGGVYDEDQVVIVQRQNLPAVIAALTRLQDGGPD